MFKKLIENISRIEAINEGIAAEHRSAVSKTLKNREKIPQNRSQKSTTTMRLASQQSSKQQYISPETTGRKLPAISQVTDLTAENDMPVNIVKTPMQPSGDMPVKEDQKASSQIKMVTPARTSSGGLSSKWENDLDTLLNLVQSDKKLKI